MARQPCMFCGASGVPLTREHSLPVWLTDVLPGHGNFTHRLENDYESRPVYEFSAPFVDLKVKAVCAPCNNGWMSGLERRVRSAISPMIRGRPVRIGAADRALIGLWAAKTAAVFSRTGRSAPGVSEEFCRVLYDGQRPPPLTWCWVGRFRQEPGSFRTMVHTVPVTLGRPNGDENHGLVWVAGMGSLAIRLLSLPSSYWGLPVRLNGSDDEYFAQVWPSERTVDWPPPKALAELDLVTASRMFRRGR